MSGWAGLIAALSGGSMEAADAYEALRERKRREENDAWERAFRQRQEQREFENDLLAARSRGYQDAPDEELVRKLSAATEGFEDTPSMANDMGMGRAARMVAGAAKSARTRDTSRDVTLTDPTGAARRLMYNAEADPRVRSERARAAIERAKIEADIAEAARRQEAVAAAYRIANGQARDGDAAIADWDKVDEFQSGASLRASRSRVRAGRGDSAPKPPKRELDSESAVQAIVVQERLFSETDPSDPRRAEFIRLNQTLIRQGVHPDRARVAALREMGLMTGGSIPRRAADDPDDPVAAVRAAVEAARSGASARPTSTRTTARPNSTPEQAAREDNAEDAYAAFEAATTRREAMDAANRMYEHYKNDPDLTPDELEEAFAELMEIVRQRFPAR